MAEVNTSGIFFLNDVRARQGSNSWPVTGLALGPEIYTSPRSSVNEGDVLTINILTRGLIPVNGFVYYTVVGSANVYANDFVIPELSGQLAVPPSGIISFQKTILADTLTEGTETFRVSLRTGSVSGPEVATTGSISVVDTSTAPPATPLLTRDATVTGQLWLWGYNGNGTIGDNTATSKSSPVQTVAGGSNWTSAVDPSGGVTAAIKSDGTLWTWGYQGLGALGNNLNTAVGISSPIQTISGGTNWAGVDTSTHAVSAVKTDGTLWFWGQNGYGQFGDNTITNYSSPVQTVAGGTNWLQSTISDGTAAAIKTDGTLWTWGRNQNGQLGDNTRNSYSSPIQTIAGGSTWRRVIVTTIMAAIKTDGTLWVWGDNTFGVLGDNTVAAKSSPVQTVAGGTNWQYVTGSNYHMAAIKTDGTLWAWGYNYPYGALGDNTVISKSSPVQTVAGGTNWSSVATQYLGCYAIKTDGTLWAWGRNNYGQLGDNTLTHRSSPIQTVVGGTSWKAIRVNHGAISTTVSAIRA